MDSPEERYEIRQAIMTVNDRDASLRVIQEIGRHHSVNIVCFDAEMLAGTRACGCGYTARTAIDYFSKTNIQLI